MPKVPEWLGNTFDAVFSRMMHTVTVTGTEFPAQALKKIRFEGDFNRLKYSPGHAIAFRVDHTNYRNYTPSYFDAEKGICDVLFYLHNRGPGSRFAQNLQTGDTIRMIEPRGKTMYDETNKYHFFFGDETSLGLFNDLKNRINANNQNYLGILELDKSYQSLPEKLGLSLDVVSKATRQAPAAEAIDCLLNEFPEDIMELWTDAVFYLTGNAQSIQAFRKALLEKGIKSRNIRTQAYWAEGKTGL